MYRHLLIATDGSAPAVTAVDGGIALASRCGAKATLFTALPRYRAREDEDAGTWRALCAEEHARRSSEAAANILREPLRRARQARVECDTLYLENDRPDQGILDAAELAHCDLIVLSSHGREGLAALVYGSVTREVLSRSRIPVLVFRRST
jgi:nucleotide-binding universal stress UspA family protein